MKAPDACFVGALNLLSCTPIGLPGIGAHAAWRLRSYVVRAGTLEGGTSFVRRGIT